MAAPKDKNEAVERALRLATLLALLHSGDELEASDIEEAKDIREYLIESAILAITGNGGSV